MPPESKPIELSSSAYRERWLLDGAEPRRYEQYKVPKLFRPLAESFVAHIGIEAGERLLDVACGTGIVARLAAPLVGPRGRVVGIDLNAQMLAIAAECKPTSGAPVEWLHADAQALPFPGAVFDSVLCQQGLQFFSERIGALREMQRVLVPGGRVALSVWGAHNPYLRALSRCLRVHVAEAAAERSLAPLALADAHRLSDLARRAGLRELDVRSTTIIRQVGDLKETFAVEIAGTPFAEEVRAAGEPTRVRIVADLEVALNAYRHGSGYSVPVETLFLTALAPHRTCR